MATLSNFVPVLSGSLSTRICHASSSSSGRGTMTQSTRDRAWRDICGTTASVSAQLHLPSILFLLFSQRSSLCCLLSCHTLLKKLKLACLNLTQEALCSVSSPCSMSSLQVPVRADQRRLHALQLLPVQVPVLQRLQQPLPHGEIRCCSC